MIHLFLAREGSEECAAASVEMLEKREPLPSGWVLWIDLDNPDEAEENLVIAWLECLHPLTLDDMRRPKRFEDSIPHLPKMENFDNYLFLVFNPLRGSTLVTGEAPACTQLSCILTDQVLLTWHYQSVSGVDSLKQQIERHASMVGRGADFLLLRVIDETVDGYLPVVDQIEDNLDNLEASLVDNPVPGVLRDLMEQKRAIQGLRRTLLHEREAVARLMRGESPRIREHQLIHFRDVHDHLLRCLEMLETNREMVSDLVQIHLGSASHRLNEVMRVLTAVSTIILPMALITGLYGMNVKIPEAEWDHGYAFVLFLLTLIGGSGYIYFRWRKWL